MQNNKNKTNQQNKKRHKKKTIKTSDKQGHMNTTQQIKNKQKKTLQTHVFTSMVGKRTQ